MSDSVELLYKQIGDVLKERDGFLLSAHVRPDGDAIGSVLGLGLALEAMGKRVLMVSEDGVPASLEFLKGSDKVVHVPDVTPEMLEGLEVMVALDTATQPRLGEGVNALFVDKGMQVINIDHHISNPAYGDINLIDSHSPATGQIVYDLLKSQGLGVPAGSRDALFVAISTDTGSFQFPSTTARTFEVVAAMTRDGLNIGEISSLTYHRQPLRKVRLLQDLLNCLELSSGDRVASWSLLNSTKERLELLPDDSEDLIDHIRSIDSVVVAVFFEELPDGKIRVSSRSKDPKVNVCNVCLKFGGGGHAMAAGARMAGPIEEARTKFLAAVDDELAAASNS
ncbi:DHH family phosphoesterase [Sulfuriroseicoccus oceanibius]|uniref:DHH family phosphoesterase n=1 Tax=Sulfuriroseicoccus oceanibius TaxID=2707525 RepID=A0A6B3L9J1_9BACT|nr:DHH family phosphoesterase [Sulfuriroseicoccus oceanibius]QQL44174.1 DHH family phosphoesterase [Sulfuriroseicoccus oceanibius]